MTTIEYLVHLLVYEMLIVAPMAFLAVPFLGGTAGTSLAVIAVALILVYFACASWLARRAAYHRVFEGAGFIEALGDAVSDGRFYVSFLPVIGRIVGTKSRRSRFEEPPGPPSSSL